MVKGGQKDNLQSPSGLQDKGSDHGGMGATHCSLHTSLKWQADDAGDGENIVSFKWKT